MSVTTCPADHLKTGDVLVLEESPWAIVLQHDFVWQPPYVFIFVKLITNPDPAPRDVILRYEVSDPVCIEATEHNTEPRNRDVDERERTDERGRQEPGDADERSKQDIRNRQERERADREWKRVQAERETGGWHDNDQNPPPPFEPTQGPGEAGRSFKDKVHSHLRQANL